MLIYWSLFLYFAVGAILTRPTERQTSMMFGLGAIITVLLIGLRYKVGADWEAYEFWFSFMRGSISPTRFGTATRDIRLSHGELSGSASKCGW